MNEIKVDKDYLEAFNQGYEVAKELGLKPDAIDGMKSGNNRMQAMKEGMEQYGKEITQEKNKDIIPPLDMDSIGNNIDLDISSNEKDKGKDMEL